MTPSPDSTLTLDVLQNGPATVVRIAGSAGMAEAQQMQATLEGLSEQSPSLLVLDLSGMNFICSTGLSAIISAHVRSRRYEGSVRLVNPQPPVRQLLELTNLTKVLPIYPTVEEALKG
jgi:anti-anti-sigma factor